MPTSLLAVFSHTPAWVWGLLAALVALGLRQARAHDVSPLRLWLQPAAIGALSIASALHAFGAAGDAPPLLAWLAGAGLGFTANRALRLPRDARPNGAGGFRVEGSWAPLALLVGVFGVRYVVGASLGMTPGLAAVPAFAVAASLAFGFPSGLLLARSIRIHGTRLAAAGVRAA